MISPRSLALSNTLRRLVYGVGVSALGIILIEAQEPFASPIGAIMARVDHLEVERCADCHPREASGFLRTGMGRSLEQARGARVIERFVWAGDGVDRYRVAQVTHPKTGVTYEATIDAEGRWWQRERFKGEGRRMEVRYIIGSGSHTRSYLGEKDGALVELPLTWYSERGAWDMSPGYEGEAHARFERLITPECLFCHADQPTSAQARLHEQGISCRRCHGDGDQHIEGHLTGSSEATIFNPASLSPQRQNQLCEQCHLSGATRVLLPGKRWRAYQPHEPLEELMVVYGYEEDTEEGPPSPRSLERFGVASHAERLALSACAQGGGGLSCAQCHDPHQPSDATDYQEACVRCHDPAGEASHPALEASSSQTSAQHRSPTEPRVTPRALVPYRTLQGCVECHMRRGPTSDIPHVRFTDHWIRVWPDPLARLKAPDAQEKEGGWRLTPLTSPPQGQLGRQLSLLTALSQVTLYGERMIEVTSVENLLGEWLIRLNEIEKHPYRALLYDAYTNLVSYGSKLDIDMLKMESFVQHVMGYPQQALIVSRWAMERAMNAPRSPEPQGWFSLAERVLRETLQGEALSTFDQIRLKIALADLYQLRGEQGDAELLYLSANQQSRVDISGPLNLSALYVTQRRWREASLWATEAVKRDPISAQPRYRQALIHLERGALSEAFAMSKLALERAHRRSERIECLTLHLELAEALGDLAQAEESLRGLIQQEPDAQRHYERLAELLWRRGRLEGALETLEQASERFKSEDLRRRVARLKTHLSRGSAPSSASSSERGPQDSRAQE